ncbi:MAG TPA: PEP-CTERM sorting domain-containing protein [Steroidobacteraceae bacterium]|nr:PEP-CTERM sorting domain-containing protein [Steroidobacteraceae bacterium]
MKKVSCLSLLAGVYALAASLQVSATPVHATFDGSVTGSDYFTHILNTYAVGTQASFDVYFDDTALVPNLPVPTFNLAPVSGTLRLGTDEFALGDGRISSYSFFTSGNQPVVSYQLQLTGTGPTLQPGNASLFGLFLNLTPSLSLLNSDSIFAGFAYPLEFGTLYSYAQLGGDFSISRATSVPEPSALLLMSAALGLLWLSRRLRKA